MLNRIISFFLLCISLMLLASCSAPPQAAPMESTAAQIELASSTLPDGTYSVDFDTDSSMFHINEAHEGKAVLTVENGKMTVHITLASKGILHLFPGTAEDARKNGAVILDPTEDLVKYKDGYEETVYGFDVPVEVLNQEFPLALIGKKGTWYDHMVSVNNPEAK